jgi:hypothetical protein
MSYGEEIALFSKYTHKFSLLDAFIGPKDGT